MLTEDQKSEIRRHLGYPAASRGHLPYTSLQTQLFHFDQASSFLEQRMDLLTPLDEAKVTGDVIGVLAFVGPEPSSGSTFTISITSSDLVSAISVGPITFVDGDTLEKMASKLSRAIAMDAALATARISGGGPYGPGLAGQDIPLPQVILKAPKVFTIAITAMTGIGVVIQQQGQHVEPHADGITGGSCGGSFESSSSNVYGFLPILAKLDALILGSSGRAQIARSGDYVRGDELNERIRLYNRYRKLLAEFMGVELPNGGCNNSFAL